MMSDVIKKSINAIPSLLAGSSFAASDDSSVSASSYGAFIRNLSSLTSKHVEQQLIERELDLLQRNFSIPTLNTSEKYDNLLRVIHCHMLGYDVSFAYIHAVKLAQQGTILEKRIGYLACCLFLSENSDLTMLLINTIHRDLSSTNLLHLCSALTAACYLVNKEMIPSLLPAIRDKLKHQKEIVRRKAVLCIRSFLCKAGEMAPLVQSHVCNILGDKDPGVVWAVVEVYRQMAMIDVSLCRDIVPPVIDILSQVTSRRLPTLFDYHTVPSPWFTISLLKLLTSITAGNPDIHELIDIMEESTVTNIVCSLSVMAHAVLHDLLQRTEPSHKAGLAVIYETLMTIVKTQSDPGLLSLAAKCTGRFLAANSVNLVYIGVSVLGLIASIDASYVVEHQDAVMKCLEHADSTVQAKSIELLFNMANNVNKDAISRCLTERLMCLSDDDNPVFKQSIVAKLVEIVNRLASSTRWYIEKISQYFQSYGSLMPLTCTEQLIYVVQQGVKSSTDLTTDNERQEYAVSSFWKILQHSPKKVDENLLCVAAWTLGEYSSKVKQLNADTVVNCLSECWLSSQSDSTKLYILSALLKLTPYATNIASVVSKVSSESACNNRLIIQRLRELQIVAELDIEEKSFVIKPVAITEMDFSFSFLDSYVCASLESGSPPYKPTIVRQQPAEWPKSELFRSVSPVLSTSVVEEHLTPPGDGYNSMPDNGISSSESDIGISVNRSLRAKGSKHVWCREGLVDSGGMIAEPVIVSSGACADGGGSREDFLSHDSARQESGTSTQMLAQADGTSIDTSRESLAAALFSGIKKPSSSVPEQCAVQLKPMSTVSIANSLLTGPIAVTSSCERCVQLSTATNDVDTSSTCNLNFSSYERYRSISPDSIDSAATAGTFCDPEQSVVHVAPTDLSKIPNDCYIQQEISELSVTADFNGLFLSGTGRSIVMPETESAIISVNFNGSHAGLQLPAKTDSDRLVARGDAPNSEVDFTMISEDINALHHYNCSEVEITLKKRLLRHCIAVDVCITRLVHSNVSVYDDAAITFSSAECLHIQINDNEKYATAHQTQLNVSLQPLIQQSSLSVTCHILPSSIDAFIRQADNDMESFVSAEVGLPRQNYQSSPLPFNISYLDFIRPLELSVEDFVGRWSYQSHEFKLVVHNDEKWFRNQLAVDRHLQLVKAAGSELLLAGCLLNSTEHCFLLHCNQTNAVKSNHRKIALWAKSFSKRLTSSVLNEISLSCSRLQRTDH